MLAVQYDNARQAGDLVRGADGNLAHGPGIVTAAILSLFLDAPARPDDPVPDDAERRGYWADVYAEDEGDVTGSRLWILHFMGATREAVDFAELAAEEALEWMIEDDLADEVIATAELRRPDTIRLRVEIRKPGEIAPSLLGAWDLEVGGAV